MTEADINRKLKEIEAISGDDEAAHSKQDALFREVLEFIAKHGAYRSASLAEAALKVLDIEFSRWCA